MPAPDPRPTELVPLGEPQGRDRWLLEHHGNQYIVWNLDDTLLVTDALCPHKQLPLMQGTVRRGAVVCPEHWYSFELGSGRCRTSLAAAAQYELTHYPVEHVAGVPHAHLPVGKPMTLAERLRAHARGSR